MVILNAMGQSPTAAAQECAPGCSPSMEANGTCDWACNDFACSFDGGDCAYPPADFDNDDDVDLIDLVHFVDCLSGPLALPAPHSPTTPADCLYIFDFDGDSDVDLANFSAFQQFFGLAGCAPGCPSTWVGDGYCDSACNVAACNFDGTDCYCAPGCPPAWIGDGICDSVCYFPACSYDNGDCNCAPGCWPSWIGDGYCDWACYFPNCSYDAGDCDKR